MSLCPNEGSVNQNDSLHRPSQNRFTLVFSEQFFTVFNKADEHDDDGAYKANKEQCFKPTHEQSCECHTSIVA